MKIKAIYKDYATLEETHVLIIACFSNRNILCMNENGDLIIANQCELRIVDERYLREVNNG